MTQATATAVVHDLIGVGFGPSNIALAIALQERAQAQGALEVLFLDKQTRFSSGNKKPRLLGGVLQTSILTSVLRHHPWWIP